MGLSSYARASTRATVRDVNEPPIHQIRETLTVLLAAQGEPADHYAEAGEPFEAGQITGAITALSWALSLLQEDPVRDREKEVRRMRRSAIAIYEHHAARLRLA